MWPRVRCSLVSCFLFTSSVIGYDQEAVVVDLEGLPVQGAMSLQSLKTEETPLPLVPVINDGQLRLYLPGVGHHQENLEDKKHEIHFAVIYNFITTILPL